MSPTGHAKEHRIKQQSIQSAGKGSDMTDASAILTHDPKEFIRGIQQILISDTKRIGFLAGAGTSIATKKTGSKKSSVPGVKDLTEKVLKSITAEKFVTAFKEIEQELKDTNVPFFIEYILSSIAQKELVVGKGSLCGLTKEDFHELKLEIEKQITAEVSVHRHYKEFVSNLLHSDFAVWIGSASRKFAVEIFTTNYDYLFEIGLERNNIPYFDGFIGGFYPFFDSVSVEDMNLLPTWTKLWKLHGSLGWDYDETTKKVFRNNRDESRIIVFPSIMKYDNSRKQPYISFMDRLGNFLKADDGVLFMCGYSFGDQHINDMLFNGLAKTKTSHAIAFCFDELTEGSEIVTLAKTQPNISIYGRRNAIIGGRFGRWKLNTTPTREDSVQIDTYFDEDAVEPDKHWEGWGDLKLVDFASFVEFLVSLQYERYRVSRGTHE